MNREYKTFMLSDEPKLFGISIITALPCVVLTALGMLTGLGYQGFVVGSVIGFIMHVKFGGFGIRFFLSIVYWMMPRAISMSLGLRRFPDSSQRIFIK